MAGIGIVGAGVSSLHLGLYLQAHDVPVDDLRGQDAGADHRRAPAEHGRAPSPHARAGARARRAPLGRRPSTATPAITTSSPGRASRSRATSTTRRCASTTASTCRGSWRTSRSAAATSSSAPTPRGGRRRARVGRPRPRRRRGGARQHRRHVPPAAREVPVRPPAAPPRRRPLPRRRTDRAARRLVLHRARPRRAARAAAAHPRGPGDRAAVREHPGWRDREARRHAGRGGHRGLRARGAGHAPRALRLGRRPRRSVLLRLHGAQGRAAGRADPGRPRGLHAAVLRHVRAGDGRHARRRRSDHRAGRELRLLLGVEGRRGDRHRPRLRRAVLPAPSRGRARSA